MIRFYETTKYNIQYQQYKIDFNLLFFKLDNFTALINRMIFPTLDSEGSVSTMRVSIGLVLQFEISIFFGRKVNLVTG